MVPLSGGDDERTFTRRHDEGRGVPRDLAQAAEYYEAAVLRGVAQAQYNLGVMFDEAIGVQQASKPL